MLEEIAPRLGGTQKQIRTGRMMAACRRIGAGAHIEQIFSALAASPGIHGAVLARRLEMDKDNLRQLLDTLMAHHLVSNAEIVGADAEGFAHRGYGYWLDRAGWQEVVDALTAFIDLIPERSPLPESRKPNRHRITAVSVPMPTSLGEVMFGSNGRFPQVAP